MIVAQKNGDTVYFDQPFPKVHFMKLLSCSLYNSWDTHKGRAGLDDRNLNPDKSVFIHRTKSRVSVFLKRGGNMQLHVSVIFTSRGNVKTQVLRDSVTFPERKLPSHVSAMFKLADFSSCFCKRIYSCLLHLPKHKPSRWFLEQQ